MAQSFNITAKLQLQAGNFQPVISSLQQQLGGFSANINANISPASARSVANMAANIQNLQQSLSAVRSSVTGVNQAFSRTGSGGTSGLKQFNTQLNSTQQAISSLQNNLNGTGNQFNALGQQAGASGRKFLAFSLGAVSFIRFAGAVKSAIGEAIEFQHNIVRLGQLGASTNAEISDIESTISNLGSSLGVSSKKLADTSIYLKGAGLSAAETKDALLALAKTSLAPTFGDIRQTTEGLISLRAQFNLSSKDYEGVLGSINSVAKEFAAESEDIIEAVRRSGAAFKAAAGDVQPAKQSLNEFIALFTSVRATTRESADSIATSFKTIFARLQSNEVVKNLKDMNIELRYTSEEAAAAGQNIEGQFVGGFKAIQRISQALKGVPTSDPRFSAIVQQVGGVRQVSKVIPLIQQSALAQKAYSSALSGSTSLTLDAEKANEALSVRLDKIRESFLELVREVSKSKALNQIVDTFLVGAKAALTFTKALTPLIPLLAGLAAAKLVIGAGSFAKGFATSVTSPNKRFATGGIVGGGNGASHSDSVHTSLAEGSFVIRAPIARKMSSQVISSLISNDGSKNHRMVPVRVMPGEIIVPPKKANQFAGYLQEINKGYANGGLVKLAKRAGINENISNDVKVDSIKGDLYGHELNTVLNAAGVIKGSNVRINTYPGHSIGVDFDGPRGYGSRYVNIDKENYKRIVSVENESFAASTKESGAATESYVRQHLFGEHKKVELTAAGDVRSYANGYSGYYVWPTKFGADGKVPERTKVAMRQDGYDTSNLHNVSDVLALRDGKEIWLHYGSSFDAIIDPSSKHTQKSLRKRLVSGIRKGNFDKPTTLGESFKGSQSENKVKSQEDVDNFDFSFANGGYIGSLPNPINRESFENRYGLNADRPRRHSADKAKKLYYGRFRGLRFREAMSQGKVSAEHLPQIEMRQARFKAKKSGIPYEIDENRSVERLNNSRGPISQYVPLTEAYKNIKGFAEGGNVGRRQYSPTVSELLKHKDKTDFVKAGFIRMLRSEHADNIASHVPQGSEVVGSGTDAVAYRTPQGDVVRIGGVGPNKERRDSFLENGRPQDNMTVQPLETARYGQYTVEKMPYVADLNKWFPTRVDKKKNILTAFSNRLLKNGKIPTDVTSSNIGIKNNKVMAIDADTYREPVDKDELEHYLRVYKASDTLKAQSLRSAGYASGGFIGKAGKLTDKLANHPVTKAIKDEVGSSSVFQAYMNSDIGYAAPVSQILALGIGESAFKHGKKLLRAKKEEPHNLGGDVGKKKREVPEGFFLHENTLIPDHLQGNQEAINQRYAINLSRNPLVRSRRTIEAALRQIPELSHLAAPYQEGDKEFTTQQAQNIIFNNESDEARYEAKRQAKRAKSRGRTYQGEEGNGYELVDLNQTIGGGNRDDSTSHASELLQDLEEGLKGKRGGAATKFRNEFLTKHAKELEGILGQSVLPLVKESPKRKTKSVSADSQSVSLPETPLPPVHAPRIPPIYDLLPNTSSSPLQLTNQPNLPNRQIEGPHTPGQAFDYATKSLPLPQYSARQQANIAARTPTGSLPSSGNTISLPGSTLPTPTPIEQTRRSNDGVPDYQTKERNPIYPLPDIQTTSKVQPTVNIHAEALATEKLKQQTLRPDVSNESEDIKKAADHLYSKGFSRKEVSRILHEESDFDSDAITNHLNNVNNSSTVPVPDVFAKSGKELFDEKLLSASRSGHAITIKQQGHYQAALADHKKAAEALGLEYKVEHNKDQKTYRFHVQPRRSDEQLFDEYVKSGGTQYKSLAEVEKRIREGAKQSPTGNGQYYRLNARKKDGESHGVTSEKEELFKRVGKNIGVKVQPTAGLTKNSPFFDKEDVAGYRHPSNKVSDRKTSKPPKPRVKPDGTRKTTHTKSDESDLVPLGPNYHGGFADEVPGKVKYSETPDGITRQIEQVKSDNNFFNSLGINSSVAVKSKVRKVKPQTSPLEDIVQPNLFDKVVTSRPLQLSPKNILDSLTKLGNKSLDAVAKGIDLTSRAIVEPRKTFGPSFKAISSKIDNFVGGVGLIGLTAANSIGDKLRNTKNTGKGLHSTLNDLVTRGTDAVINAGDRGAAAVDNGKKFITSLPRKTFDSAAVNLPKVLTRVNKFADPIAASLFKGLRAIGPTPRQLLTGNLGPYIKSLPGRAANASVRGFDAIGSGLTKQFDKIADAASKAGNGLVSFTENGIHSAISGIKSLPSRLNGAAKSVGNTVTNSRLFNDPLSVTLLRLNSAVSNLTSKVKFNAGGQPQPRPTPIFVPPAPPGTIPVGQQSNPFNGPNQKGALDYHLDNLEKEHYRSGSTTKFDRDKEKSKIVKDVKSQVYANRGTFNPLRGFDTPTKKESELFAAQNDVAASLNSLPSQQVTTDLGLGSITNKEKKQGYTSRKYQDVISGLSNDSKTRVQNQIRAAVGHDKDAIKDVAKGNANVIFDRNGDVSSVRSTRHVQDSQEDKVRNRQNTINKLKPDGVFGFDSFKSAFSKLKDNSVADISPLSQEEEFQFHLAKSQAADPSKIDESRELLINNRGGYKKATGKFGKFGAGFSKIGRIGLGAGAVAAQFAPQIAEHFTGTVENTGQFGVAGVKTGQAIGGGLSGAASGALIGSAFGPIGAAIGGVVGGFKGITDSLKEVDKQIAEISIGKKLTAVDKSIDDYLSDRKTATESVSAISSGLKDFDSTESSINSSSTQFADNSFGRFLHKVIGAGGTVGSEERTQARKKYVKENIEPRVGLYRQLNEKLASETEIDPSLLKSDGLSEQQLEEQRQKRLAAFNAKGGAEITSKIVEATPGLTAEKYEKEIDKQIVEANRQKLQTQSLTKALVQQELEFQKFSRIGAAIDSVVESMNNLHNGLDATEAAFNGTLQPIKAFSNLSALENKGGLDDEGHAKAVGYVTSSLKRNATGSTADLIDNLGKNAIDTNKLRSILPSIISDASSKGSTQGEGLVNNILKGVEDHGKTGSGPNEEGDIPSVIRERLSDLLGAIDPQELAKQAGENVQKLVDDLMGKGFANVNEVLNNAARQLEENSNRFNSDLIKYQEMINKIGESQDKLSTNQVAAVGSRLKVKSIVSGRTDQLDIPVSTQLAPSQARQERLTGLTGSDANNPEVIDGRLAGVRGKINKLTEQAKTESLPSAAAEELTRLQGAAGRLNQALEDLANPTERNAILQERLSRIEESRNSKLSFAEKLITATPQQRAEIRRNATYSDVAVQQGHFGGFSADQARGAIEHLDSLGEAELAGYGGERASSVKQRLVANSTKLSLPGFIDKEDTARLSTAKAIDNNNQTAVKAQDFIVKDMQNLQSKFFSDLHALQESFFTELSTKLGEAAKRDLDVRENQNKENAGKVSNAKQSSDFFSSIGLNVEQAKKLNSGGLSDIKDLKLQKGNLQGKFDNVSKQISEGSGSIGALLEKGYQFGNATTGSQKEIDERDVARTGLSKELAAKLGSTPEDIRSQVLNSDLDEKIDKKRINGSISFNDLHEVVNSQLGNYKAKVSQNVQGQIDQKTDEAAKNTFGGNVVTNKQRKAVSQASNLGLIDYQQKLKPLEVDGFGSDQEIGLKQAAVNKESESITEGRAKLEIPRPKSVFQAQSSIPIDSVPTPQVVSNQSAVVNKLQTNFSSVPVSQETEKRSAVPGLPNVPASITGEVIKPRIRRPTISSILANEDLAFNGPKQPKFTIDQLNRQDNFDAGIPPIKAKRFKPDVKAAKIADQKTIDAFTSSENPSADTINSGVLARANQLERDGQSGKAKYLRSQVSSGRADSSLITADSKDIKSVSPKIAARIDADKKVVASIIPGQPLNKAQYQARARQLDRDGLGTQAALVRKQSIGNTLLTTRIRPDSLQARRNPDATQTQKSEEQKTKQQQDLVNNNKERQINNQTTVPPSAKDAPKEQTKKVADPAVEFSQNIQTLGGIVSDFSKTINNMGTTLSGIANIFKEIKIPEKLVVEQNGRIEVIHNGAQVYASIQNGLREMIVQEVESQFSNKLSSILKEMPRTG